MHSSEGVKRKDPIAAGAERTISAILRAWADQTPEAVAIEAPGRAPLTHAGLLAHVESTLGTLNAMGVGRKDRVAVVLPNGPEMAVAFLSVSVGATSAPLNPAHDQRDFAFYMTDLGAKALLVQSGLDSPARAAAKELGIPIMELSPLLEAAAGVFALQGEQRSESIEGGMAQASDVALLLHTSGTTSRPKIVPLTHANLWTSANNIRSAYCLGDNDRCLNVMPLFHIHGLVGAILATLASGASTVCTPGFDEARFFEWMAVFNPTWYTAVPTMHHAILKQADSNRAIIARCSLRFVRSCSAALPPSLMGELEQVLRVPVLEAYGMTEAAHQMTSNPLPPAPRKAGSVGVPTGPEVAVMDETGTLSKTGKAGEIVIRGESVTQGYENNPGANDRAFVDGWFRTGDQGFFDEDGYLTITGRIKEIINRGGEKVAPRLVDEALLEHPSVAQAVTFAVPHATLGEDVATAVVLQEGATATEQELRGAAFDRLADYQVPSQIVVVGEIPKGPTGKLQRIGLAEKLEPQLKTAYIAPRDELELELVMTWQQVLGVKPIGVRDNFFALGGDSLTAADLHARIEQTFGTSMSLPAFFRVPTIEHLATVLREEHATAPRPPGGARMEQRAWIGLRNRLLQILALYAPGQKTTRVRLHRMRGVRIGKNVSIGLGAIIESAYPSLISIGDNVNIGVRAVIIAHFQGSTIGAMERHEPSVVIEDNVYVGPSVTILPNVTLGEGCVVAAGSVVNMSVQPLTMAQGNPAKPVARCGVPLAGNSYGHFLRCLTPIEE